MATLALNIITLENDADVLERCLNTCKGKLFDERVIVDTTKEESTKIKDLCSKFDCKYFHFQWCDDFSAARNYAIKNTTTEYFLWLDSDDVIRNTDYQKLLELKNTLQEFNVYYLDYIYAHDANDNDVLTLIRERIAKVCKEIFWEEIIHEGLCIVAKAKRVNIAVHHYKKSITKERNNKLLEKAYNNNPSERIKFYYAKELYDNDEFEKAVKILEAYIDNTTDFLDNQVVACLKLVHYYSFKSIDVKKALYYAYKAIAFNPHYAEPYYQLGLMFQFRNNIAFDFFKHCLTKNFDAGFQQFKDQYRYLPARQLAFLYAHEDNIAEARKYIALAQITKTDKELEDLSKKIGKAEIKVLWLVPGKIDATNASLRIRRLNIHNAIKNSAILENYQQQRYDKLIDLFKEFNVFVFMNFSLADLFLMRILRDLNKVVVFDHCENIFDFQWQDICMRTATVITCCSTVLAEETKKHGFDNVIVIPDAIEDAKVKQDYKSDKLRAGFFGMGGNSWMVTSWLKDTLEQTGYELVNCTEWDDATIKWDLDTWQDEMLKCDVILCPQRIDIQPAKSNVKVTQAMSMGLPVIGSAIQAYKEAISHDNNGYLATTLKDWKECLEFLRDEKVRERIGREATKNLGNYTIDTVSKRWVDVMTGILTNIDKTEIKIQAVDRQVDIIIPNYNNFDYLRLCLDSILQNTTTQYRVIISDAGSNKATWDELKKLKGFTIIGEQDQRLTFAQACNDAINISKSKYFVILNSDTIVSKNWLNNMLKKMQANERLAACGVLSNCDVGWLINVKDKPTYNMQVNKDLTLHPGMKIEQVKQHLDDLYSFMNKSNEENKDKFVEQNWVAAYCTLYVRSAIDEVGLFDESFENGSEDLDLNIRLSKFGYKTGQAIDAFVFHFGGVSRSIAQQENKAIYDIQDKQNHSRLKIKWAQKKIAIWTGPAWEKWDELKVQDGMAGSETWAVYLAHAFAKLGFIVYVFNNKEEPGMVEEIDNVHYIDYTMMEEFLKYNVIDHFISSRSCEAFKQKIHSLDNFVMIHDVFIHSDKNYDIQRDKVNKYLCLSNWHKEFVKQHHNIPDNKLHKTANGLPFEYYKDVDSYEKKNQAIYSSSPDRGLWQLLQMLPAIRKEIPDFTLYIAYGFHNWESMAKQRNDIKGLEFIERIKQAIEQPGVVYLGRISKQELARYEIESKVLLYPTWFDETFCITAATAGIAKCAILSTAKGGLLDTVGDCGILLPSDGLKPNEAYPEPYVAQFVETAIKLYNDDAYRCSWANKAYNKMQAYNWATIAQDLIKLFTKGV